jgi:hypothetical protein
MESLPPPSARRPVFDPEGETPYKPLPDIKVENGPPPIPEGP